MEKYNRHSQEEERLNGEKEKYRKRYLKGVNRLINDYYNPDIDLQEIKLDIVIVADAITRELVAEGKKTKETYSIIVCAGYGNDGIESGEVIIDPLDSDKRRSAHMFAGVDYPTSLGYLKFACKLLDSVTKLYKDSPLPKTK